MISNTNQRKFQSSYLWFKRNDSVVLLETKQDYKCQQILNQIYTQNISNFIDIHRNCFEDIQNYSKTYKQAYCEKIEFEKLRQIYSKNEMKIFKEILHRNQKTKKSLQSFIQIFPFPNHCPPIISPCHSILSPPQQKPIIKSEINVKLHQGNKTRTNKEILIVDQSFRKQLYDKQMKCNKMNHFDKIYQTITSNIFSKNHNLCTEESRRHNFFSEKDRNNIVPNRIKMAKIASKIKKIDLVRRNYQDEDELIRRQKTNKVGLSLGEQIMNKFRLSKNDLKLQINHNQTLTEIAKLKQKIQMNKSRQIHFYKSISKANIPLSVSVAQHQGYRPKNRYFEAIFQQHRLKY